MKLYFREMGVGQPLLILHGLFGSSDNWQTIAKQLSLNYHLFLIDQRNHGQSPHSDEWNYKVMADDVILFCEEHQLKNINIIGHSMGGKTAMTVAEKAPQLISKMMVIDISPRAYPLHHQTILKALGSVNFDIIVSRKQAEETLNLFIHDLGTKQFLLKNLYWVSDGVLSWRFNLPAIEKNIAIVGEATPLNQQDICTITTCFVRGEKSDYINEHDVLLISQLYPRSQLITIANAGHWVHAENPHELLQTMLNFFS